MQRPLEFTARHKVTGEYREYNYGMQPYLRCGEVDMWDHWIDTRYKAKLRLYNYINGIKPISIAERQRIGESFPILNF